MNSGRLDALRNQLTDLQQEAQHSYDTIAQSLTERGTSVEEQAQLYAAKQVRKRRASRAYWRKRNRSQRRREAFL